MKKRGRGFLYVVLAAGLIGLGASSGTFATFNATTTNPGNTFTTGSLYLSNSANSGTACFSYGPGSTSNVNNGCNAIISLNGSAYPGGPVQAGAVDVANGGSINAAKFEVYGGSCTNSYGLTATATTTVNSTNVTGTFPSSIVAGATVVGTGIQSSPATTVASNSGTSLTLSQDATASGTVTLSFSLGTLNSGGTLCSGTDMYIEDITTTPTCEYGECPAEAQVSGSTITSSSTSIAFTGSLGSNAAANDEIELMNPSGQSMLFTISGTSSPLTVTYVSGSGSFPAGSAILDITHPTFSGSADTLTTFGGSTSGTPAASLGSFAAGASRTFQVGLYLPSTGSDNPYQDLTATFPITWYASQT